MVRVGAFVIGFLLSICSFAQMQLGLKGGLNLADIVINNSNDPDVEPAYKIKAGLHAGFYFSAMADNDWGFTLELLYSNKGTRAINNINLHYISIPILARYRFHKNLVAEAGPELSYLVNANSKYGNLNSTWDNKLDLGLDAGVLWTLGKISLGARFAAGFSSVIRATGTGFSGERITYQNRVIQFFVAVPIKEIIP